jgi:hypothetical protein
MGQAYTDFSEYGTGSQPSGWTRHGTNSNGSWTIQTASGAEGGQVLRYTRSVSGSASYWLAWEALGDLPGDIDMYVRFRRTTLWGTATPVLTLSLHRNWSPFDGYGVNWVIATTSGVRQFDLTKHNSGTFTSLDNQTGVDNPTQNEWYWVRFQRTSTTNRVQRWQGGFGDFPGTWVVSTSDSDFSSGEVAVCTNIVDSSDTHTIEFDVVSVGWDGDPAPSEPVNVNMSIDAPLMTASGTLIAPSVGVFATVDTPAMQASGALLPPVIRIAATVDAPVMSATGTFPIPFVNFDLPFRPRGAISVDGGPRSAITQPGRRGTFRVR